MIIQNTKGFTVVLLLQHLPGVGTLAKPTLENPKFNTSFSMKKKKEAQEYSVCLSQKLCFDLRNPYNFVNEYTCTHIHTHTHNYVIKKNPIPLSEGHSSQLGPTISSLRIQIFFFLIHFIIFFKWQFNFFSWLEKPLQNFLTSQFFCNRINPQKKTYAARHMSLATFYHGSWKETWRTSHSSTSQRVVIAVGLTLVTGWHSCLPCPEHSGLILWSAIHLCPSVTGIHLTAF